MTREEKEKINAVFSTSLKNVIGGYIYLTGHHKVITTSLLIDGEVYDVVVVKSNRPDTKEGDKE